MNAIVQSQVHLDVAGDIVYIKTKWSKTNVGIIKFDPIVPPVPFDTSLKNFEIGYRIDERFQSKGYATSALIEFTQYVFKNGFNNSQVDCIYAKVLESNKKSMQVLKKCGFSHVGDYLPGIRLYSKEPQRQLNG